jgi:hypothetical protein
VKALTLIDAVYNVLKQDSTFMGYFGLTPSSDPEDIVKRLVRGMEPDGPITSRNIPLCLMYDKPGRYGRNYLVYEGKFCLDVYAKSAFDARTITEKAFTLFHDRPLDNSFKTFNCFMSYDDDFATGITGVKGREIIFDVDYVRMN